MCCCLGGIFIAKGVATKLTETLNNDHLFVEEALTATGKTWDEKRFSGYADDSFNTPARREETKKLFATLKSKLGMLTSLEKPVEEKQSFKADSTSADPGFFVTLKAKAKFEKGNGIFTVTVKNYKSKAKIVDIHLDPDPGSKTPK